MQMLAKLTAFSCLFAVAYGQATASCPDMNNDGTIDVTDVLSILGQFRITGNGVAGDLDSNGRIDVNDVMSVLSAFGTSCTTDDAATCESSDYSVEDYVVWSSSGHDIDHMQGTAEQCMAACCEASRPENSQHPEAPCIGFGRRKAAAADQVSDCWLKTYALEADRVYGNNIYHFYQNMDIVRATPAVAHACAGEGITLNAVYGITLNFPDAASTDGTCAWTLYCDDEGEVPKITFNSLTLSGGDSIMIYDGHDSSTAQVLEQLNDGSATGVQYAGSTDHMYIVMQQDGEGNNDGFEARYICGPAPPPPPPPPPSPPPPTEVCTAASDCGGQVYTDCGTMCPRQCGQSAPLMCNFMCFQGFQCPAGVFWDDENGQCVAESACPGGSTGGGGGGGGGNLPPGLALGRPFTVSAKPSPTVSPLVSAVSDWVVEF
eukprot:SAG22_NODE_690_length_7891_cov_11.959322_7_plen_432_part_00